MKKGASRAYPERKALGEKIAIWPKTIARKNGVPVGRDPATSPHRGRKGKPEKANYGE